MHFLQDVFQMTTIALISVINHYHINGLHLFWDILYIYIYINSELVNVLKSDLEWMIWKMKENNLGVKLFYIWYRRWKNNSILVIVLLLINFYWVGGSVITYSTIIIAGYENKIVISIFSYLISIQALTFSLILIG